MNEVHYDKTMIGQLDGILSASTEVLETVRAAMALDKATAETVEHLLALREGLCLYLGEYDRGNFIPEDKRAALAEKEDEATDLLGQLQRDDQTYECPEFRQHRSTSLAARLRILESTGS